MCILSTARKSQATVSFLAVRPKAFRLIGSVATSDAAPYVVDAVAKAAVEKKSSMENINGERQVRHFGAGNN